MEKDFKTSFTLVLLLLYRVFSAWGLWWYCKGFKGLIEMSVSLYKPFKNRINLKSVKNTCKCRKQSRNA